MRQAIVYTLHSLWRLTAARTRQALFTTRADAAGPTTHTRNSRALMRRSFGRPSMSFLARGWWQQKSITPSPAAVSHE
jgi:hypothetical protein